MFKNYLKIALRNLWRQRGFSFINIGGLAIGLTAFFLILLYVSFELSYDNFHSKSDQIYRVVADIKTPSENIEASSVAWAVLPNLTKEFPEIVSSVRITDADMLVRRNDIIFDESNVIAADSTFFEIFDFKLVQGDLKTGTQSRVLQPWEISRINRGLQSNTRKVNLASKRLDKIGAIRGDDGSYTLPEGASAKDQRKFEKQNARLIGFRSNVKNSQIAINSGRGAGELVRSGQRNTGQDEQTRKQQERLKRKEQMKRQQK